MPEILENKHNFICGMTGTGKTYFTLKQLEASNYPVFFFNPQETETNFVDVDGSYSATDIINALKAGEKLNYIPSKSLRGAKTEINYIIQKIFEYDRLRDKKFYFAVDECHLVAPQNANNEYINMVPTRGRVFGFMGVFIAQRPAAVDKTILTQCPQHIIFHTEYEAAYFRAKGIDSDKIAEMLGDFKVKPHNYVIYESGNIKGPFTEK